MDDERQENKSYRAPKAGPKAEKKKLKNPNHVDQKELRKKERVARDPSKPLTDAQRRANPKVRVCLRIRVDCYTIHGYHRCVHIGDIYANLSRPCCSRRRSVSSRPSQP